jgi:signal transduction histidine kinase/DNA-binding response OmpR family regulator
MNANTGKLDFGEHTILIIDDEPANLRMMSDYLGSFGFGVLIARDGESGFEKAQYAQPDLILLDVLMPGMDGFETCQRLKADEMAKDIPVIFMTALAEIEDKVKGFRLGAVDYVTKPFQHEEILARITTHLRLRELTERLEHRVRERTQELTIANQHLQREIAERVRAEEEIRRRATQQEALNTIITATVGALDLPDLLETALDHILPALGLEMGAIWVAGQSALRGLPTEFVTNARMAHAAGLDIPGPIAVRDWEEEAVLHELGEIVDESFTAIAPQIKRFGIRASITVPFLVEGKRAGGLSVATAEPRSWFPEEIALVEAVGYQLGTTVERLELVQEIQRHADELLCTLEQQRELDRLKREFIQNVSHELRTPLALARGYAELLESGELGELQTKQREPVAIVVRRLRTLSNLVDDINAISETESKPLERESVDLVNMVSTILADCQSTVEERGLTLKDEIPVNLPLLFGDPVLLWRVLDNLLNNALKFTSAGGHITVRLWQEGTEIALQVVDTGIGIPADQLERIFDRFYQVDGSATRRYGGTGLGLALVKEIAEAHGGRVTVESYVEQGSTFTVWLPLADA